MVTGGHLGFMQIRKFAKSCRLGNQTKFVHRPHVNTNPSKDFIGSTFPAFRHIKPTITDGRRERNEISHKDNLGDEDDARAFVALNVLCTMQ